MRAAVIFFLLVVSLIFAEYSEPPLEEIKDTLARSVDLVFVNELGSTSERSDIEAPVRYADFYPFTLYPAVDGIILSNNTNYVIFASNYSYFKGGSYLASEESGVCERQNRKTASFSRAYFSGNVTFSYINFSRKVEVTGNLSYIEIPFQNEFEAGSGMENLTIEVFGIYNFSYDRSDEIIETFEGCTHSTKRYQAIYAIPVNSSRNFSVAGNAVLFFLSKPVLGEQLYDNSKFETIVFSKKPFYRAEIYLNNTQLANSNISYFNVSRNIINSIIALEHYPFQSANMSANISLQFVSPKQLQENDTPYYYIYTFSANYSARGKNNLTIKLHDYFGNSNSYKREIFARELAFESSQNDSENYRKIPVVQKEKLNNEIVLPALAGVLLFLAYLLSKIS